VALVLKLGTTGREMKTRHGFVSNSSSSSFVLVATREDHDQAIKTLDKKAAEVINASVAFKKIGDQEIALLFHTDHNEGICVHNWDNVDKEVTQDYIDFYDLEDEETEGSDEVYCTWTGYFSQYAAAIKNAATSQEYR